MNSRQEGVSLVEVVVAVVLLSVILVALTGLTFTTAAQSVLNNDSAHAQAASLEAVNRFSSMPWASLPLNGVRVDTAGTGRNRYQRRVTVTQSGPSAEVVVVTTPLQRKAIALTVRFNRVQPLAANPLCLGC